MAAICGGAPAEELDRVKASESMCDTVKTAVDLELARREKIAPEGVQPVQEGV